MFEDRYHPAVKKDLRKIDAVGRKDIKAEWIAYLLKEEEHIVEVLMIGKREGFYEILRRRLA